MSTCLMAALLGAGLAAPAAAAESDPVRLDVGIAAGTDPAAVLAVLDGSVVSSRPVPGLDALAVDVPADRADNALAALGRTAGVRYAERGSVIQADSDLLNDGLQAMEIPQAWTWTTGSPTVTVAVVDTGVSPTVDLGADRLVPGYDAVDGDTDTADGDGHGTLVAGIIAADPTNDTGISGVCGQCQVMPVRVMNGREGTSADAAAGIAWAADHGAKVINASLSTASPSRLLQDAVEHAAARGSLVVASAGNVASTARRYPAAFESALAVGRVGMAQNTATDRWVDVAAYGNFVALNPAGQRTWFFGTSGSTAAVAGVAALAFAMKPASSAQDVRTTIVRGADFFSTVPAHQAPILNAARVVYDLGGTDTTAPTVTKTGLTEDEPIGIRGEAMVPQTLDDHGVERVEVVVEGKVVSVINHPGSQVTLRPPAGFNGPLPVTVNAYDYAGNIGSATTVVQADTVVPTGTLISPAPNAVVHGDTVDVTIVTPDNDLAYVVPESDPDLCGCSSLTRVAGTNQWKGKAQVNPATGEVGVALWDRAGNLTRVIHVVRIDNEPPAGGTIAPASGARVRGTFTSTLAGVSDLGGVAKTELWANGKYVGVDRSAPYALAVKTGSYSGKLTLTWKATDRWGQSRTLPVRTVTVDNAGPSVSITKAPKHKAKVKGTVKVYVKASDAAGVARVELLVNGKVVAKDTTAGYVLKVSTGKQKRTMKVQIRAYDRLGNVKYTSARTWYRR
ncbi:S8 family serine peptidase [Actinoplanes sp. NPDC049668]|uniref:S8 family serine peptidase n=1 Tax=unclassified Actinoplanes TaxID=2626549 RepID=UPI0033BEFE83